LSNQQQITLTALRPVVIVPASAIGHLHFALRAVGNPSVRGWKMLKTTGESHPEDQLGTRAFRDRGAARRCERNLQPNELVARG
jgi:hypothetical protein